MHGMPKLDQSTLDALSQIDTLPKEARIKRAQELYYDSCDAPDDETEMALIGLSLIHDPENIDSILAMMNSIQIPPFVRLAALKGMVLTAEPKLDQKRLSEGNIWGHISLRPYMRAREALGEEMRRLDLLDEAIENYSLMLKYNENDNQGIRYALLPCLMIQGRLAQARELMNTYREGHVVFRWLYALERFLVGKLDEAAVAVAAAKKENKFIEKFMLNVQKIPKRVPHTYSAGSKEEAVIFTPSILESWEAHDGALEWLHGVRPSI
jgi:tetratricopeptide (TPR) repeat protein